MYMYLFLAFIFSCTTIFAAQIAVPANLDSHLLNAPKGTQQDIILLRIADAKTNTQLQRIVTQISLINKYFRDFMRNSFAIQTAIIKQRISRARVENDLQKIEKYITTLPGDVQNQLSKSNEIKQAFQKQREDITKIWMPKLHQLERTFAFQWPITTQGLDYVKEQASSRYNLLDLMVPKNDLEKARLLLEAGADPDIIVDKTSPLSNAVRNSNYDMVKLLLDFHADPNTYYNEETALTLAIFQRCTSTRPILEAIIQLLLEHNADPNLKNKQGVSPLLIALSWKNKRNIVEQLLKHGANPNQKSAFHPYSVAKAEFPNMIMTPREFVQRKAESDPYYKEMQQLLEKYSKKN